MPLYQVDFTNAEAVAIQPVPYASEGILERQNLQRLIAANLECLGEELFLIKESFKELEGSLREVDILALDRDANLVIIELKRTDGGEYADLQAIRYAGMLSSLNFADVAKIHAGAFKKELGDSEQAIRDFLETEMDSPVISDRPRIFLVAPSFTKEVAMTCLWLINAKIDIRCIKASLYKIGEQHHIDIEQELPQPTAAQYQYRLRDKQAQREAVAVQQEQKKRSGWAIPILEKQGVLTPGTVLEMRQYKHYLTSVPESLRTAIFHSKDHDGIEWNGSRYNLSKLNEHIFQTYANTRNKVNPTELWQIKDENQTLSERAAAFSLADTSAVTLSEVVESGEATEV